MSDNFVDCDANCTYTVSFHRGKWINMKLELMEALASSLLSLEF